MESAVSVIKDFAEEYKRHTTTRLDVKGLFNVFVYLKEENGCGPWILVEGSALDRYPALAECLRLASVSRSRSEVYRFEKFFRFELKKCNADQVLVVLKATLRQRQDLKPYFNK